MKNTIWILAAVIAVYFVMKKQPEIRNFPNTNTAIVAFGDSLTAGYGAPKGSSYPDYLAQQLGQPVLNLGLSGELAVHAPERLPDVLKHKPYMVLIEFGANDFMQQRSMEEAVNAVAHIVDAVQAAGAIAVIVDTGGPNMDGYTAAYKKLAKEKQAVFVPTILHGIFNHRGLKSDLVHPNAQGYEKVAQKVYKEIKPFVTK
jgi:lysophospholipase L1-like esterase